ncbi:MAG: serine protease, partial [Kiritimatiellae bacterium]|nr:serine protease [Kiritimatiellia bacterium]
GTRCENTCDKHPDTHLKNGLCEKCGEKPTPPPITYCDIHLDVPLQGELCPRRCIVPSCGGHLAKDSGTRCENTCDKHPDTHLKNGLCEKCGEKPIPTFVAEVKLVDEKKSGQRFYPAFAVNSPDENTKALSWQWNAHIGNRAVAVSVEGEVCTLTDGLSANDTCVVDASATVSRNGRKVLLKARPYTWTKNLPPPESVERNLALYGDSRIDPKTQREYFTIKLYSQPEDGRASVSEWAAKLVDQEMPIPVTPCKDNTMRLYKTDIKQDGRIRITAHVEIEGGKARDISAVFVFKSDILSAEGDIDTSQVIDNATTIRKVWGNSVLLCYVPGVGQGTAFAVSQMDLITNYHVVGNKSDVELFFANSKPSERIDGKVVAVNKEADLAWLRTERGLQVNPFIVGLADDLLQKSSEVIAMGFPYWATESAEKDCKSIPDLWVSAGTIVSVAQGQFLHNAPITHGSSGGPLVSVGGELLGINTGSFYDVEEGEQTSSVMRAIPAVRIQECFPRLQLVGKGGR